MQIIKRSWILTALMFIQSFLPLQAQEMLGLVNGNYAGVNSVHINPSSLLNSKVYLDINLIGADVFHQNNYLYMSADEYRFFDFFEKGYTFKTHPTQYTYGERPFYTYDNTSDKYAHSQIRVLGPSAMLVMNSHAFAIHTSSRSVNIIKDIPYDMANFFYYGLSYIPQRDEQFTHDKEYNITTLSWSEVGISWAYALKRIFNKSWNIGITAKAVFGHAGVYVNGYNTDYIVPNGHDVNIINLDAETGYALPMDYSTNKFMAGNLIKGTGFGFDIGLTYQKNKKSFSKIKYKRLCNQRFEEYDYRIGFSILDLGKVAFSDNARVYTFDNASVYWQDVDSVLKTYDNINQFSQGLSENLCGSPTCAQTANAFSIALPTAISAQLDYNLAKKWYLNATIIQPVRTGKAYLYRPSVMAIVPRFETRVFEFSMPLSLYNYRLPRVGAAMRIYNVTVGTEKLLGFFNFTSFSGLDIYFAVKIYIPKGNCRKRKNEIFCNDTPYRMSKRNYPRDTW